MKNLKEQFDEAVRLRKLWVQAADRLELAEEELGSARRDAVTALDAYCIVETEIKAMIDDAANEKKPRI